MAVRHGSEEQATKKLLGLRPHMERFRDPRLSQLAPRARPQSVLWHDDAAAAPHPLSIEAWWAILHAIDHLNAAYDLTVEQGSGGLVTVTTRPLAVFPLMRASFENALRAGWLLGADTRQERAARRLRLVLTDAWNFDESTGLVKGATQPATRKPTLERLRPVAVAAGVSMTRLKEPARPREIVRDGGAALGGGADDLEFIWRTLSALTHGDRWAIRNYLDHDVVPGQPVDEVALVRASSSIDLVATHMSICVRWAEEAIALFVRQANAPEPGSGVGGEGSEPDAPGRSQR